jgi:hypothetical protein
MTDTQETTDRVLRALGYDLSAPPLVLTQDDVAKLLDVKPNTLMAWRSTGRYNLPFIKIGRNARYPLEGVVEFVIRRTRTSDLED